MSVIIRISDQANQDLETYIKSGLHSKVLGRYGSRKKVDIVSDLVIQRIEAVHVQASMESARL